MSMIETLIKTALTSEKAKDLAFDGGYKARSLVNDLVRDNDKVEFDEEVAELLVAFAKGFAEEQPIEKPLG